MKMSMKIMILAFAVVTLGSCTKGIEFEEVPMDVQNEVGLKDACARVYARELFQGKILQLNYGENNYVDMLLTNQISNYESAKTYTNTTSAPMTIQGTVVPAGGSIQLKNNVTPVYEAGAPEDSVYIVQVFVPDSTFYNTPNKGHVFVQSKFTDAAQQPFFIDPVDGQSARIRMVVDPKRLIVALLLNEGNACTVQQVGDAPELGKPGDFSVPRRYIVENENDRNGLGKRQRLYEVRVSLLP